MGTTLVQLLAQWHMVQRSPFSISRVYIGHSIRQLLDRQQRQLLVISQQRKQYVIRALAKCLEVPEDTLTNGVE